MRDKFRPDEIIIVEQADDKKFNRGKLLNIGFLEIPDSHYVFHDVDMIPIDVDYSPRAGVTQMANSAIQLKDYLGGVTMFDSSMMIIANGYPNDFYRGEDNCMMFTLKAMSYRIRYRIGAFAILNHARPELEFDPVAWARAQTPRGSNNGLTDCDYECTKIQMDDYTLLKCYT